MGLTRPRAHQLQDIDYKQTARALTDSNITLSGGAPSVVDGVSLLANDRILVTGQSDGSQNGIYYVTTLGAGSNGTWDRSLDANATGEISAGTVIMVTEGDVYADNQWKLITDNPITIGTTPLIFKLSSSNSYGVFAVDGQNSIIANSVGDTVTFASGNNISITNNAGTETLTIAGSDNPTLQGLTLTGDVTGNILPSANVTYNLGSTTQRWNELYLSGSTIHIGSLQLKDEAGVLGIFGSDGTTQAALDQASVINPTITLSGDASGSGTTSIVVTVADDSHNHIISNVDGLQTALDGKQPTGAYLTSNQTITLSGDLTGSGTTAINAQLAANVVNANELNVVGNGTTEQYLRSDGDGSFTWATPSSGTTYTAGTGLNLVGTTFNNTAPDQTVSLTQGGATTITGTYPSFTISSTDTNTTYTAGSGIALTGTAFSVAAGGGLTQDAGGLSHADTSTQASLTALTGANVVSDIDLDTYGHVTALATRAMTAADLGALTSNQTITLSGDLTGSGTTSISAQIAANVVGASELNVTGNGLATQFLRSDADGTFTWAVPTDTNTTYTAGTGLALTGTVFSNTITNNNQLTNGAGYITSDTTKLPLAGGAMTGAITTTSTFDGRDVSVDGAKLDGIAAGANNYSFPYTVSSAAGINTVVQRDASGYTFGNYFNGTGTFSATGITSGMGIFTGTNGIDTYGRSYTAAAARTLLNVADGATNVTNNNQLTNGAAYITSSASISGNAATATALQTARTINGVSFNGSANITVTADANLAGNLLTAVPSGALFTDTVYTLPTNIPANIHYVNAGNGYGLNFWGVADTYSIQMGNNQVDHGTVTDYSMHHNMGTTAGRGFTFGSSRTAVSASINALTGAADFNGTVTGATFNATSTSGGGFQGIDADTAAVPSFTWTSDQNTGMWHAAADQIGFTTAGVNRLTIAGTLITSTVQMNATTFNATSTSGGGFQGIDADSAAAPSFTWSADLNTGIWRPTTDQIGFTTAGVNRLTLSTTALTSTLGITAPTFTGIASSAKYADLAEKYTTDQEYPVGTVMQVSEHDEYETESANHDSISIGVISAEPAYLMNSDSNGQAIGLKGRVPVRIIGPVKKGQAVYCGDNGTANATLNGCCLVGVALESNSDALEKLVECVLKV